MSGETLRSRILAGGGLALLVVAVMANFATLSARLVVSPLLPDIIDAFDSSKGTVGFALTLMWGAYALAQFPSGSLTDRFGERRVVLTALLALGVGSLLLAASPTFVLFVAAAVVVGVGAGLYFPAGVSLLTSRYEERGTVLGFHVAGSALGGLVSPPLAAFVAVRHGWRAGILVGTIVALVALVAVALTVDSTPPRANDGSERELIDLAYVVDLFGRPVVLYTTVLAAIGSFSFQAFAAFFPTFLVEFHGRSPQSAGVTFSAIFFVGTVSLPALGRVSDYLGRNGAVAVAFTASSVGYLSLLVDDATRTVVAATLLLGVGFGFGGVVQAKFMDLLAQDERGRGFGLIRTAYVLVGALGGVVTGTVADRWGWVAAITLIVGLLVFALASLAVRAAVRAGR